MSAIAMSMEAWHIAVAEHAARSGALADTVLSFGATQEALCATAEPVCTSLMATGHPWVPSMAAAILDAAVRGDGDELLELMQTIRDRLGAHCDD